MSKYRITLIPGDGIGPEISKVTLMVLKCIEDISGISLEFINLQAGDTSFRLTGSALPNDTINAIENSQACLKGPVGEKAMESIVKLRQKLNLYVNLRPVKSYPNVPCFRADIDFIIVRENSEDLYKGLEFELNDSVVALRVISEKASKRIAEFAFNLAEKRNKKKRVIAIHKSNVMQKSCGLFSRSCKKIAEQHKNITFSEMYVDAAAMNLIRNPQEFDVLVTTNMFGDILSDEASQLIGGLGMAPSGNIGEMLALFEPVHGSAPDIAGKGVANPFSMILSSKMMFEWLSTRYNDPKCKEVAEIIEKSVLGVLSQGIRTVDIGGTYSTNEVGHAIIKYIQNNLDSNE
jgi:3-isopropylmalate dehydrogenase